MDESPMEVSDESSESSSADASSDGDSVLSGVSAEDSAFEESAFSSEVPDEGRPRLSGLVEDPPADQDTTTTTSTPSNPPSASRGRAAAAEDEEEGALCNICLSAWANYGSHRICSLKCGHLFGHKCLERWLSNKKNCPTCKTRVRAKDIWPIHVGKLVPSDPAETAEVRGRLRRAVEERDRAAAELKVSRDKETELMEEVAELNRELRERTRGGAGQASRVAAASASSSASSSAPLRLYRDKSLDVCKQAGCRVLATSGPLDLMVASMKSPNNLFSGYGLKKISLSTCKQLSFVPLHKQPIRDVCFHPESMWTLTVGMDKTVKVVDLASNNVLGGASCQTPVWSCCWDADNGYHFYCGTQSGTVYKYDLRNLGAPVASLSVPGDMSPVVSVAKIPNRPGHRTVNAGVISCKLNSLWFFQNDSEEYTRHNLPLDGPFVSMKYQRESDQLLVSARPNNRCPYSRHVVCGLERRDAEVGCNVVHTFAGGGMQKFLSKSTFISDNDNDYVAAFRESDQCVHLWSVNSGQKVAAAPVRDVVLDLGGVETTTGNYLVSLTARKLDVFKFIQR